MSTETGGPSGVETVDAPVPAPSEDAPERAGRSRWVTAGYVIACVLALIPAARMIGIVLDGSELQHADYWMMLPRILTSSGGLDLGGLFHFQNGHPVVIAQTLYWLNVRAFSGSNFSLGFVIIAVVIGQLVVIGLMLRRSSLQPIERMVLLVLASVLLFDLTGSSTFLKSMSGAAWLTANLFALVAVYLRSRDWRWPAFGVAIVAAASYGTGIMVWPALIAAGVSRRPIRECWREWPYAVGAVATFLWYRTAPHGEGVSAPIDTMRAAARMLGFVLGLNGDIAELIGFVALIGVPILAVYCALVARAPGVAGWVGLATYGWLALMEIASGRLRFLEIFGVQGRYTSLNAIVWIGFTALLIFAVRDGAARLVARRARGASSALPRHVGTAAAFLVAIPLVVGAATAGRGEADALIAFNAQQDLSEIAMQFGLTDSARYFAAFGARNDVATLLRRTGHYPFVDDWDLDCGLRGRRIVPDSAGAEPTVEGSVVSGQPVGVFLPTGVEITGTVVSDRSIRCLVVTNDAGTVIGAATVGTTPAVAGEAFQALAKRGERAYRLYVVFDGDSRPNLLGGISNQEIEPG